MLVNWEMACTHRDGSILTDTFLQTGHCESALPMQTSIRQRGRPHQHLVVSHTQVSTHAPRTVRANASLSANLSVGTLADPCVASSEALRARSAALIGHNAETWSNADNGTEKVFDSFWLSCLMGQVRKSVGLLCGRMRERARCHGSVIYPQTFVTSAS